jgi:hypothetical protein
MKYHVIKSLTQVHQRQICHICGYFFEYLPEDDKLGNNNYIVVCPECQDYQPCDDPYDEDYWWEN